MLGLAPVTSGSIKFSGREIGHRSRSERRALSSELQVVFQDPYSSLNPSLTIERTLTEPLLVQRVPKKEAAARVRSGYFNGDGAMPLNTHGGLLSYGHCGVGGAMAHLVETHLQMTGRAGDRQVRDASIALLHGDGGVLSSHVSMFLEQVR